MEGTSVVSVPTPVAVVPAMSPVVSAGASAPTSQEEGALPPASSHSIVSVAPQITALVQVQPTVTNAPATALALAAPTPLDLHASTQPTKLNILKGRWSYFTYFFIRPSISPSGYT